MSFGVEVEQVKTQVRFRVDDVVARAVVRERLGGRLAGGEPDDGDLADDVANEVIAEGRDLRGRACGLG